MSQGGAPDRLNELRRLVASLERREAAPKAAGDSVALCGAAGVWLDAALGGGARRDALYEIEPDGAGDQPSACGFVLGLALRFAQANAGSVVWIAEDFAWQERGAPYGPGLRCWGLDPSRLVLARAPNPRLALWALEEALKCQACAAVIGEFWRFDQRHGDAARRRLALAARESGTPCLLLHAGAEAIPATPGAQARFAVRAAPQAGTTGPCFSVRLLKARAMGGRVPPLDPETRRLLAWSPASGAFAQPAQAPRPALRLAARAS